MRRRFGHESFFSSFRPVSHRERRNADLFLTELMAGGRIRSSASMLRPPSESTLEDVVRAHGATVPGLLVRRHERVPRGCLRAELTRSGCPIRALATT